MKYFLAAPLSTFIDGSEFGLESPAADLAGPGMRSRTRYRASELQQSWTAIDPGTTAEVGAPVLENAWIVSVRGSSILALIVESGADAKPKSLAAVEEGLSDFVTDFAATHPQLRGATPRWVSRTLLLAEKGSAPAGWLEASAEHLRLTDDDVDGTAREVELRLGWGNNTINGWVTGGNPERSPLLRGIVDAQYLWVEIDALSNESARSVHDIVDARGKSKYQAYDVRLGELEDLSTQLALHNLAYDDLLTHIQGSQRAVATALLRAWNYSDVVARISRRISDTTRVLEQRKSRQERRSQRVVEAILFGLALIAFVELALSAMVTSVETEHGDELRGPSILGIMPWIRQTDPDILIFGAIVAILLTIVIVNVSKRIRR